MKKVCRPGTASSGKVNYYSILFWGSLAKRGADLICAPAAWNDSKRPERLIRAEAAAAAEGNEVHILRLNPLDVR
ncbi:MAG: hypothetical protein PHY77_00880 [Desulfotomaculaceae bacterium]|nr:hypothetical protein [Desulfotomaculaceae bacterium]